MSCGYLRDKPSGQKVQPMNSPKMGSRVVIKETSRLGQCGWNKVNEVGKD